VADVAYIALGSNLGDRAGYLSSARAALSLIPHTELIAATRVEETIPLGNRPQSPYLNQMVALRSTLAPDVLLDALHRIERALGRARGERWSSRTIDLDIVQIGSVRVNTDRLILPHPGISNRDFWQREVDELDGMLRGEQ
jgi:2-amino-4-hydroxy-6-hydroxymethyldihydropteridine diphosphokinase